MNGDKINVAKTNYGIFTGRSTHIDLSIYNAPVEVVLPFESSWNVSI